jgi:predicted transcriptional regulator
VIKPTWAALGALERQVMEIAWREERLTVRDVQSRLARAVAYTTVMTTLDRLYKKGVMGRTRAGRAFVYQAALSREQLEGAAASVVVTSLLANRSGNAAPLLSNLVDAVGGQDDALDLLETLEQMVREKRRRLRREERQERDRR